MEGRRTVDDNLVVGHIDTRPSLEVQADTATIGCHPTKGLTCAQNKAVGIRLNGQHIVLPCVDLPTKPDGDQAAALLQANMTEVTAVEALLVLLQCNVHAHLLLEGVSPHTRVLDSLDKNRCDAMTGGAQRDRQLTHQEARWGSRTDDRKPCCQGCRVETGTPLRIAQEGES